MGNDNDGACVWIDSHAHLYGCKNGELETLVTSAKNAGVGVIVNTATSIDTARVVMDQCRRFPEILRAAAGISPFDTVDAGGDWADRLKELLAEFSSSIPTVTTNKPHHPQIIAIGETGLDCTNPRYPPIDTQMPFFTKQLEIAVDTNLPAIIHSRGIEKKTAEICRGIGVSKAVFHCFTGDLESLEFIVDCGYYVSISGIVTYKNSHLRDIIKHIPLDKLLIETDTPYLSPIPHRGKQNRPAFLVDTAKEVSKLLGIDEEKLAGALKENFKNIFYTR